MGILISLIVVAALVVIGAIGSNAPAVFGVAIPYAAIAIFIVGVIVRIFQWAATPVPFRIPTTAGQQKSLDFIRTNRFDNPSSTVGVIVRMLLEVLFFRSLFRNTKQDLKEGPKITYGSDKWLWLAGLAFHWSFLIIFLRHFRFFVNPDPFFVAHLEKIDGFFQVGLPIIMATDALIVLAVTFLFTRRITNKKVRYISLTQDYFPLLLILAIAVTGILMKYFTKVELVDVKQMMVGVLSFSPVVIEGIDSLFYIHLFLVCSLLIYFPMSKLVHMPGVFMSPTRNMINNNREKFHKNPWDDELKLHYHTYAEYEDEFRDLMKGVGLPLEKEDGDGGKS